MMKIKKIFQKLVTNISKRKKIIKNMINEFKINPKNSKFSQVVK